MEPRLLERAKIAFEQCNEFFGKRKDDDIYTDWACFFLNQSIVYYLLYLIGEPAQRVSAPYAITDLLYRLPDGYTRASWYSELLAMSDEITSWEHNCRYKYDFVWDMQTFRNAISSTKSIIRDIECNTVYLSDYSTTIRKILHKIGSKYTYEEIISLLPTVELPKNELETLITKISFDLE